MIYGVKPTRTYRSYYGGENLDKMSGNIPARKDRFPEDWLCSVTRAFNPGREVPNDGLSVLYDGRYLADVIDADHADMIGENDRMSLLFKLLDSAERLTVQVHPTVDFAKKYFGSEFGKTECWYILNDGGYVYIGFKPNVTKAQFKEIFDKQDIPAMLDCLHRFDVHRGDIIFVPGGVPHAIGANCFLAELQEPTDLMVVPERVTPSGVALAEEKLHGGLGFEKMFDCFCYNGVGREETYKKYFKPPTPVNETEKMIIDSTMTDKFCLSEIKVDGEYVRNIDEYAILLVLEGSGECNSVPLKAYERFFVPYSEKTIRFKGKMKILICCPHSALEREKEK